MDETNLIGAEAAALAEDDGAEGANDTSTGAEGHSKAALAEIAEGKTDELLDDAAGGDAGNEGQAAAAGDAAAGGQQGDGAAADAGAAAAGGDDDAESAALVASTAPQPVYMAVPSTDGLEDRKATLIAERSALRTKYDQGELGRAELDDKVDAINDDLASINNTVRQAETALAFNQNLARQVFQQEVQNVLAESKAAGFDLSANPMLMGAWDARVRALAADEAMVRRGDSYILRKAAADVRKGAESAAASLGYSRGAAAPAAPAAPAVDPKAAVKAAIDARKVKTPRVGSLATLPQADGQADAGGNEFAALDNLAGMELETALARLSPDAQARYLNGQ